MKKFLSVLLAAIMVCSMLPMGVFAEEEASVIEYTEDVVTDQPLVITENTVINGNGNTYTYTGKDRAITVEAGTTANLTINNLTIVAENAARGVNYNTTGTLTLNGVDITCNNYAVSLPGSSDNSIVTINNSKLTGKNTVNVWGENMEINITDTEIYSVDSSTAENYVAINLNSDGTISADGTVVTITGGKISALDEKDKASKAYKNDTSSGSISISNTTEVTGTELITVARVTFEGTENFYTCETLAGAVECAANGSVITLLADVDVGSGVVFDKSVTLDLNGNTITGNDDVLSVKTEGVTLIINDSAEGGKVVSTAEDYRGSVYVKNGSVVINGGTFESMISRGYSVYASSNSNVEINGGVFNAEYCSVILGSKNADVVINDGIFNNSISGNGNATGADLTINGGIITSEDEAAIYHPQNGNLTITGGTITGATAVYVKSGSVTITGGTLTATGEKQDYEYYGSGCVVTGDALVIETVGGDTGYAPVSSVSITGGTFESENGAAVASYAATTKNPEAVPVTGFISGGTFDEDVSDYCAEGYEVEANEDGTYGITEEPEAEANGTAVQIAAVTNWADAKNYNRVAFVSAVSQAAYDEKYDGGGYKYSGCGIAVTVNGTTQYFNTTSVATTGTITAGPTTYDKGMTDLFGDDAIALHYAVLVFEESAFPVGTAIEYYTYCIDTKGARYAESAVSSIAIQ